MAAVYIKDNFDALKGIFSKRVDSTDSKLRKILVQVGHCSKSVGAEEIFQFLMNMLMNPI